MANSKEGILVGGVVIDGLNIKKDLFYYKIPRFLFEKAKIGARVAVPFGKKNIISSGFLFVLEKRKQTEDLKEIIDVISPPIFDENTRDLILFVSEKFFIPLHIFANKILKGISPEIYKRFVICTDCEGLKYAAENYLGLKKEVAEFILRRKTVPLSVIKKRFGDSADKVVKFLEDEGFVERESISEKRSLGYAFLNLPKENIIDAINEIKDKILKRSALEVTGRIINAKTPLREDELRRGIRYGRKTIRVLSEKGVISIKHTNEQLENRKIGKAEFSIISGGSLFERTNELSNLIDGGSRTVIIFPEMSVLKRVADVYKKRFGKSVFVWNGRDKRKLLEAIYFKKKNVFLTTSFALFVKIPGLTRIVLENASSRYFKKTSFTPFDTLITAIKKALLENLNLVFSTSVPEENIYYLMQKGYIKRQQAFIRKKLILSDIKVVDMREEFRKHNYKMLSLALQRKIKSVLREGKNVALLLNRKSYSTFVMCRECGYVMRCPSCNVPLYYDKEQNVLFCHICGYKEKPPDICPRCGSTNIRYFSGGIQKLEEQIKKLFPEASIVKLISEKKESDIIYSSGYKKTIFIGTEYLVSHLDFSGIGVFGLVSADIFLNHFSFDASVETFAVISEIATELKNGSELYIQTYIPENFVLKYAKNLDFNGFFKEEFYIRKELRYPPFGDLIVFTVFSRSRESAEENASAFKNIISEIVGDNGNVYGPSPSAVETKGDYHFFEVSVKVEKLSENIRKEFLRFSNDIKNADITVEPYISIDEGLM